MPNTIASGPDWATVMTAFGTVGAVIAAVGIAIWSSLATKSQLQKQRVEAQKLEQRSQAAAVEVLAFHAKPSWKRLQRKPSGLPVVIVVNRGKYAITDLDVRLSLKSQGDIPLSSEPPSMRQNAVEPANLPPHWTDDAHDNLGKAYSDTIAPGAAIRFKGDPMPDGDLDTSYPIVRWRDYWGYRWKYVNGSVQEPEKQADWLSQSPKATGED